jgi:hypothetical protein
LVQNGLIEQDENVEDSNGEVIGVFGARDE